MFKNNTGPGAAILNPAADSWETFMSRFVSLYSPVESVAILKELTFSGGFVELVDSQAALHVHVGDGLFFSKPSADSKKPLCDDLMEACATHLESLCQVTPHRTTHDLMAKAIGYKIRTKLVTLTSPGNLALLYSALRKFVVKDFIITVWLHSIISMSVRGAILRRELLSIPATVFAFLGRWPKQAVR